MKITVIEIVVTRVSPSIGCITATSILLIISYFSECRSIYINAAISQQFLIKRSTYTAMSQLYLLKKYIYTAMSQLYLLKKNIHAAVSLLYP